MASILRAFGRLALSMAGLAVAGAAHAQPPMAPVNKLPDPYRAVLQWQQLPEGRAMGAAAGIDIDPDGRSVWIAERCGANSCKDSPLPMIMKFDSSGKLLKAFGTGALLTPHGLFVDRDGNVWVTDMGLDEAGHRGDVVVKFSPEGKVLIVLGTPGVAGMGPDTFTQPCDGVVGANGDIFVSDGHSGQDGGATAAASGRIVKFSKDGKFIKSWGRLGSGPGEFKNPHGLAIDSAGRLFVADRGNNRIQIFDQDGRYLTEWRQFSRPSGIYIRGDTLYVSDSESRTSNHPGGWKRGVRVGSASTGEVKYFTPWLPEPTPDAPASGMEGVTADAAGNIYGSNTYLREFFAGAPWGEVRKFVKP